MIELAQHIEVLLLENDCVIIPGFGGFVAHYTPAMRVKEEKLFFPPVRTVGFNPQLKLNDGVLVQSYMNVYNTSFADATRTIEKEVNELIAVLHEEGKVDLGNIGELRYTIHDTYEFIPCNIKITTPYLYGFGSFEIEELSVLQQHSSRELAASATPALEKRTYAIRINRTFLRTTAAAVIAILLFFTYSTPIENTYIEKNNYAQLLPSELFEKAEKQSVAITPVMIQKNEQTASEQASVSTQQQTKKITPDQARIPKPVAVREVRVISKQPESTAASASSSAKEAQNTKISGSTSVNGHFHIIVAAGIGVKDAEKMAVQLRNSGYSNATVLNSNGKVRVSILSFSTREDATKQLLKIRENEAYKNAWMLAE